MSIIPFRTFYSDRKPVLFKPDTETKFVDQSEADRCSLSYQLERFGMDSLLQQLEKTKSQFGYADTRLTKDFVKLSESMAEAQSYFMQLPSKIRAQFGHDCIKFYDSIEKNPEDMFKRGFISENLYKQLCPSDIKDTSSVNNDLPDNSNNNPGNSVPNNDSVNASADPVNENS